MKKVLFALMLLFSFKSVASHIVGGEFELLHLSDFSYRLNLVLYFDELNGNPGARDPNALASVFRKSDNVRMFEVNLPFNREESVEYSNPDCPDDFIVTQRFLYSAVVNLPASNYSDPEGYYVVWERCCRNYQITNIFSQNPDSGGISAGQTFYLEFPPVTKDGEQFINSTPQLFPPLSDYACIFKPYYVDFGGTDVDGDSLVYSLSVPLNSSTSDAVPIPSPRPHPEVVWRPGFGSDDILHGSPDLEISKDGFLTATPTETGLFVFAVKCEEFRDGVKLGELRRDFQMLVIDQCDDVEPQILGKRLTDVNYIFDEQMSVTFASGVPDSQRCIQVRVSDDDSNHPGDNFTENVSIRAIALNFEEDISDILPAVTEAVLTNGSVQEFGEICFPSCPYLQDTPYEIGIIAFDDACSQPESDTLKITVTVVPPPNDDPYFTVGGSRTNTVTLTETEGVNKVVSIDNILGRDDNGDNLTLEILPQGFELDEAGITFADPVFTSGQVRTSMTWNLDCQQVNYNVGTELEILLIVDDEDECLFAHPDTLSINLSIELPPNTDPEVYSIDLGDDETAYYRLEYTLDEALSFRVFAEDSDNDQIALSAVGADFDLADFGASFPEVSGAGVPGISSVFSWDLLCERFSLVEQDSFRVYFGVEDLDRCQITNQDTLTVDFIFSPPVNIMPGISFTNENNNVDVDGNQLSSLFGEQMDVAINGVDPDGDSVGIRLLEVQGGADPGEFIFEDKVGLGNVSSNLLWNPECTIFPNGAEEAVFTFVFETYDLPCVNEVAGADTLSITLLVKDLESFETEFLPPNFFSPNGDAYNRYFALEGINEKTGESIPNSLPEDNCAHQFESVKVYNRWGEEVYSTRDREFRWSGDGVPAGVYFYHIKFTNEKQYKGSLSIVY